MVGLEPAGRAPAERANRGHRSARRIDPWPLGWVAGAMSVVVVVIVGLMRLFS